MMGTTPAGAWESGRKLPALELSFAKLSFNQVPTRCHAETNLDARSRTRCKSRAPNDMDYRLSPFLDLETEMQGQDKSSKD